LALLRARHGSAAPLILSWNRPPMNELTYLQAIVIGLL
jgi:hypothetical protein